MLNYLFGELQSFFLNRRIYMVIKYQDIMENMWILKKIINYFDILTSIIFNITIISISNYYSNILIFYFNILILLFSIILIFNYVNISIF